MDETESTWKKLSSSQGVDTYKRLEASLDTLSLKGIGIIEAPADTLLELMRKNELVTKWMPYVNSKISIKELNEDHRITLTLIKMPWPVELRQVIAEEKISYLDAKTILVEMRSVDQQVETHPDAIKAQIHHSRFHLRKLNEYSTKLTLEVNGDPKGLIPKWIVNLAQKEWPRQVILGLRKMSDKS